MAFDNFIDRAKQTAIDIKDRVGDPSSKVGDAVIDVINDLNDALPQLAKAGYTMTELEIEVGIPPKLIPHFNVDETLVENSAHSLAGLEGNKVGYTLFKALLKASDLQQKIVINEMSFARIEIELGLVPAVRLSYRPKFKKS